MELIQAIALLCQVAASPTHKPAAVYQTQCQQSYINCVAKRRSTMSEQDALERCILEK